MSGKDISCRCRTVAGEEGRERKERAKKVQTAGGGGAVVRGRFAPVLLWNEKKTRAISH